MARIQIVGGGIGGLSAAIALGRLGHPVALYERAPAFAPAGAGIVLAANATAILRALGVDLSAGQPLASLDLHGPGGRPLAGLPVAALGFEVLAFHRGELHAALVAALPDNVTLHMGTEASSDPDADLVIGADGLHSQVRAEVHGALPLRYSGESCWRAILHDCPAQGLPLDRVTESWGARGRVGLVPLQGGRAYLFLTAVVPRGQQSPPWPELRARYADLGPQVQSALDLVDPAALLHHDLEELDVLAWGRGHIWLLGDAAHGMTPNQGQGAGMAIEDAAALARALDHRVHPDLVSAHARYVAARHVRVHKVQLDSRRFGRLASLESAPLRWLRDTVVRCTPEGVARRQYQELVWPGLLLARGLGLASGLG